MDQQSQNTLTIQGLRVKLSQTPYGPLLDRENSQLEPLVWIVNLALTDQLPGLAEKLEKGENYNYHGFSITRPNPQEDWTEALLRWVNLTGELLVLDSDLYVLSTDSVHYSLLLPRQTLLDLLFTLQRYRQESLLPAAPWLFSPESAFLSPAPDGEKELLQELEQAAISLDLLEKEQGQSAKVLAKRRVLLTQLELYGLLATYHAAEKQVWLENWNLPFLLAYYRAALELASYFTSSQRKKFPQNTYNGPLKNAPISLDWFRLKETPPSGYDAFEWLGFWEATLLVSNPEQGGFGSLMTQESGKWYQLYWRKDNGSTTALVKVEGFAP